MKKEGYSINATVCGLLTVSCHFYGSRYFLSTMSLFFSTGRCGKENIKTFSQFLLNCKILKVYSSPIHLNLSFTISKTLNLFYFNV